MKTTTTPEDKIATHHRVLQGFGALDLGQKFSWSFLKTEKLAPNGHSRSPFRIYLSGLEQSTPDHQRIAPLIGY